MHEGDESPCSGHVTKRRQKRMASCRIRSAFLHQKISMQRIEDVGEVSYVSTVLVLASTLAVMPVARGVSPSLR